MQGPSEKNIIPNFNKRKRPRQALYAFPGKDSQNTDSGGTPSSAPYSQQTFSGSNQYAGHGTNDGWQGTSKSVHQRTNATSNRPRAPSVPYQPSNPHTTNQGPQQQSGHMKQTLRPWQQKYDEPSLAKTCRPSASPAPQSSNVHYAQRYAHRNNTQEHQGPRYTSVHPPAMHQQAMHQQAMHQQAMHPPIMQQSSVHQPSTHQATMRHAASPRQRPELPHTPQSHTARGSMGNAPSPFRMPSSPQMPLRHSQPSTAAWEMRNTESAGCSVDKSMKMLTVSIEELRYWTVSRDIQGLLFFELFGILNSAVCSNETGLAKKFTLKDGNHTLQCIFYETDRPLGPLTRGQCLRSTGNILPKEGVFRCVSVRPATLSEQKVMRSMVAACDRGVRERLTATGVEP